MKLLSQPDDFPVELLEILLTADRRVFLVLNEKTIVSERLYFEIIIKVHNLRNFRIRRSPQQCLVELSGHTGGSDDQPLAVLLHKALGKLRLTVKVFQMRFGYTAVQIYSARLVFCENDRVAGFHLADCVLIHASFPVQRIQVINPLFAKHRHKFHKNPGRTFGVIHGTVMMFQRNSHRLGNRIQLETGQVRQKELCHRHCIHISEFPVNLLPPALHLDKSGIEIRIVGYQNSSFTEFAKPRKNHLNRRRVLYHFIRDAGQLRDPERDRDFGVYEFRKTVDNLPLLHPYRTDFDDLACQVGQTGCLDIKNHIAVLKTLSPAVGCNSFQIVHQIRFHAIDDLKGCPDLFQFILVRIRMFLGIFFLIRLINGLEGMICLREGLNHAVVGDRDRRHSPVVRPLY